MYLYSRLKSYILHFTNICTVEGLFSSTSKVPNKHTVVKQELQFLRLGDSLQQQILDTLKYIHGPDFKLTAAADYVDPQTDVLKKYWVGRGTLVVKGGCDYSQGKDAPTDEEERLKLFALMRLQSYGFHESHCVEAFTHCDNSVEEALHLLYTKYMGLTERDDVEPDLTDYELRDMKTDEKSSLESIYESGFSEKTPNVWTVNLKVDYLFHMFHNKKPPIKKVQKKTKEKCKNFLRGVQCKYGSKCRYSHEPDPVENNDDHHLDSHFFELEFRFPEQSKYPFKPPLIFLKTNVCLPPLMSLHICKRLYQEADLLALDGIPCIYSVTEFFKNEEQMKEHLKTDIDFLDPRQKLFPTQEVDEDRKLLPKHYRKGATNKDNKKKLTLDEIVQQDQRIVAEFSQKQLNHKYTSMVTRRKLLPAWKLKNDILNTIQKSQVIVISGETGCGKSTQVPQFILDEWIANYNNQHLEIVCTQPRRISAIGVAER